MVGAGSEPAMPTARQEFYTDWDMERGAFKTGRLPKPLGPSELQARRSAIYAETCEVG